MSNDSLPDHVVEEILFRLSVKEVVRTSVLSRAWHRRWQFLPVLSFVKDTPAVAIDKVLLARSAPIKGLSIDLHVKDNGTPAANYLGRWLVLLSSRHSDSLTSLCLVLSPIRWLSTRISSLILSSFRSLTYLSLKDCCLSPPALPGFPLLRTLILSHVGLSDEHHLSTLVSGCPSLEDLSLSYVRPFRCLRIHNPNLRSLHVESFSCENITFVGGQIRAKVSLLGRPYLKKAVDLTELFGNAVCNGTFDLRCIPIEAKSTPFYFHFRQLKVLILKGYWGRLAMLPVDSIPSFHFQLLTVLSMDVDWRDMSSIRLFLFLTRSAPNLQQLSLTWQRGRNYTNLIKDYLTKGLHPPEDFQHQDFWNKQSMNHRSDKLITVEMHRTMFTQSEMGFMQFLLARTLVLEKLIVVGADEPVPLISKPVLEVLNKCHESALEVLNKCHRASTQTQIQITTTKYCKS